MLALIASARMSSQRQRVPPVDEPWASVDAVAAHIGVAKDSVYRWIDAKHMPAHKIGKLWKFKLSEVDRWVRDGGANGRTPAARRRKATKARTGR